MNRQFREFSSALLLACSTALGAASAARADAIDDYMRRQVRKHHIPGLSLAVVKDGKVIKAAGYGFANIEDRARATPQTVYGLASMSKQFAAAACMLLVQDGKVSLDAPISTYLPGTPDAWKEIKVRHLLSHTSGLPREGMRTEPKTGRDDFSREELWSAAIKLPLQSKPGDRYSYSNLGFNLVALIVEKVSGKSYGDFLQARIFGPLGMKSTRVNDYRTPIANRACGYDWTANGLRIADPTSPTLYCGAGAIVSTVLDLARWDAALYTDKLLTAESRRQMWQATRLNGGRTANYGFGWMVGSLHGHAQVAHDGLLAGFRTYITRFLNDRLTVIVLTNLGNLPGPDYIADGVARTYFPDITDYLTEAGTGANAVGSGGEAPRIKPEALAALAGRYEYANNRMLTIEVSKGRLLAHLPGSDNDIYTPLSENVFVCDEEATRLTILWDASGEPSQIEIQEYDSKRKIARIGPLPHLLKPAPDPDTARTAAILEALKAIAAGGKPVADSKALTPGAKDDFAPGEADLAGLQAIAYLGERDIAASKLTRHGGAIAKVLYYQWKTDKATRYLQVYLTAGGLVTDEDVVDD
ncbi:MAG TPA: serine hydrolase domain-containing protein [Chthonomonadaceae bacterium]|nr:serine hydrolase domain-containing protein [Chthonomonadaceae bacterium]